MPRLPFSLFTSSERWQGDQIGAMAIYCSDGRWGEAFDEFCHRGLLIPRYDRFAVPGGPAWICQISSRLPELQRAARGQLEFLVRAHNLDRLVLITHFDCGFYRHHTGKAARDCIPIQLADLRTAALALRDWFVGVTVEGYVAMRNEITFSFHRIEV